MLLFFFGGGGSKATNLAPLYHCFFTPYIFPILGGAIRNSEEDFGNRSYVQGKFKSSCSGWSTFCKKF
jgi:hypothetical protein